LVPLRLEEDAWREVLAFQLNNGLESPSQAVRVMIDIALQSKQLDEAFRRAAWREGTRKAARRLREEMDAAVARALGVDA
jgi:hypothetical protein